MYDFGWHKLHGTKTLASAAATLQILRDIFDWKSVLDIGCGDGRWLSTAQVMGCLDIQGIDGPWTERTQLLVPESFLLIKDLSGSFDLGRKFDLAISLEVAEHVAPDHAEAFVGNLVRHSDAVLFGAAIPYQGGYQHINERWQSYWFKLFEAAGYRGFDPIRAQLWPREDIHYWYKQNALFYVKLGRTDLIEKVERYIRERNIAPLPLDIVHPEKFLAIASYEQIAFRPLFSKLPTQLVHKVMGVSGETLKRIGISRRMAN